LKVLVTGSSGHLGEALVRLLGTTGHEVSGLDLLPGRYTNLVGTITDRRFLRDGLQGVDSVIHTATLHKPHVASHDRQSFVDVNITGSLNLLEEAVSAGVKSFVFTSTTSAFGAALTPPEDAPAAWIDESVQPVPKNIYGATKTAAEDLCQLFHRDHGLNCVVLRTSRFFPEEDDSRAVRETYADANIKANEFLYRRVDLEDVATAHIAALARAGEIGFGRYIISATTPFETCDLKELRHAPAKVVQQHFPDFPEVYARLGFRMFSAIDRVYVNARARRDLGWKPQYDFARILAQIASGKPIGSGLAREVGSKGYHAETYREGPYPVA